MRRHLRAAFTLYELLAAMSALALLLGLAPPAVLRVQERSARARSMNNLKQIAIAAHNYYDTNGQFPPGNDANNYSARAYLLPYIEQVNVYKLIDFKDPVEKATARNIVIKTYLSPLDPIKVVTTDLGATNYLLNAGSQYALADNDGVFYQGSKTKLPDILDGTSNTIMIGETLKGDGGVRAMDVRRQHVALKKDALKGLTPDAGVQEFKDDKMIEADRCASWLDGRFLQGTFNGTRMANDEKPDVTCEGLGGLSGLRTTNDLVTVAMCDGSTRTVSVKVDVKVWKAATTRNGGEVLPDF
jgi:Tfp pilus assembly protein PilE